MMNYLWSGMILVGLLYSIFAGTLGNVTEAVVNSAREAVNLVISIAGITAFWTGIMKIAEQAGLVEKLARKINPLLRFLFPELEKEEKANYYISLNFLSNFLGLSHASTSSGLLAFQELDRINGHSTTASRAMPTVRRFSAMRVMRSFSSFFPAVMVVAESIGLSGVRATGISRSSVRP